MSFTVHNFHGDLIGRVYAPNFETAEKRASRFYPMFAYILEE